MSLTLEQQVRWLFRANAVINVALSIRGIVDPAGMAVAFGGAVPDYPFLIRLWSGLVWIPFILYCDIRLRPAMRRPPRTEAALQP